MQESRGAVSGRDQSTQLAVAYSNVGDGLPRGRRGRRWCPTTRRSPWGGDTDGITGVLAALGGEDERLAHREARLRRSCRPGRLVAAAADRFGRLAGVVLNHARSQLGAVDELNQQRWI